MFNLSFYRKNFIILGFFVFIFSSKCLFSDTTIFDAIDNGDAKLVRRFIEQEEVKFLNKENSYNSFAPRETLLNAACYKGDLAIIKLICDYLEPRNYGYSDHVNKKIIEKKDEQALKKSELVYGDEYLFRSYVNKRGSDGNTPLMCASSLYENQGGNKKIKPLDVVRFLIGRGAIFGIDLKNDEGKTALYCAIEAGNFEIAGYLLEHGASMGKEFIDSVKKNIISGSENREILEKRFNALIEKKNLIDKKGGIVVWM